MLEKSLMLLISIAFLASCQAEPETKMCERFEFSLHSEKWNEARRILHNLAIEERRDFQDRSHPARKEEVGGGLNITLSSGTSIKFYLSSTGHWLYSPEKVTLYMSEKQDKTRVICTSEKHVFEKAKSRLLALAEKSSCFF